MKQGLLSITIIAMLIFSTNACSQSTRVTGSKNYITKEVKVDNFTEIKLTGSPDVIYTQSPGKAKVEIYGSDNIVDLIETYVKDGALIVQFKSNTQINNSGKLEVRVNSAQLNRVNITGSGDVTFANGIKGTDNLTLSIQGSGDIGGTNITCQNLSIAIQGSGDIQLNEIASSFTKVAISGSGDIELNGKSKKAEYSVSGSGDISAEGLMVEDLSARVSGSGDIKCYATTTLKAHVGGSGDIEYKGNPQVESSRKGVHKL